MKVTFFVQIVMAIIVATMLPANLAASKHAKPSGQADPLSGEWNATFQMDGGNAFTRTFKLKLTGKKVSGTASSTTAGEGTIVGTWEEGELDMAIESERGTMTLTGKLQAGQLTGDWDVGHAKGKWIAKKK